MINTGIALFNDDRQRIRDQHFTVSYVPANTVGLTHTTLTWTWKIQNNTIKHDEARSCKFIFIVFTHAHTYTHTHTPD